MLLKDNNSEAFVLLWLLLWN